MSVSSTTCWWRKLFSRLQYRAMILFLLSLTLQTLHVSSSSHHDSKRDMGIRNLNEKTTFHPKYLERLAQAMAYAKILRNETLPTIDEDSLIMRPAGCTNTQPKKHYDRCQKRLEEAKTLNGSFLNFLDFNDQLAPPKPVLHCTSHLIEFKTYFRMEFDDHTLEKFSSKDQFPLVFVVEKEVDGEWDDAAAIIYEYWMIPLNTTIGRTYRIRTTAVSPLHVYRPQISQPITIYEASEQIINTPKNFRVTSTVIDRRAARTTPRVTLRWESGSGTNASCDFDIFYMDHDDHYKKERKKPDEAFWVVLDQIQFDRNYSVNLIEKFGSGRETNSAKIYVTTSCLKLQNYSFDLCAPPAPKNIRVEYDTKDSFWVVWDAPKYQNKTNRILSYRLSVDRLSLYPLDMIPVIIVPGNETRQKIHNMTTTGKIKINLYATSKGGTSDLPGSLEYQFIEVQSAWTKILEKFWVVIVIFVLIVMSVLIVIYLKNFHDRLQRNREKKKKWKEMDEEVPPPPDIDRYASKWEIDFENLVFRDRVGKGEFGEVRKAVLHAHDGSKSIVAVKTLRVPPEFVAEAYGTEGISTKDIIENHFRDEFKNLKSIKPHKHVIRLIGIVRNPVPALVVEFCDGGDLLKHLRKASYSGEDYSPSSSLKGSTVNLQPNSNKVRVQLQMVTNETYFFKEGPEIVLTPMDLLSYARQVASGMEYLAINKILHRDLAARNILVSGKDRILKIADFGLSRDVYEDNSYQMRSHGKIPIKWLAIECLEREVYTSKSDVWSYGVLLWEIITFGAKPYVGIENSEMLDKLKKGFRMSKPEHCSDELYDKVMKRCWEADPNKRPNFTEIRREIESIIESMTSQSGEVAYLSLDTSNGGSIHYSELVPSISISNDSVR